MVSASERQQPGPLTIHLHHSQLHLAFSFNELGGQEQTACFQLWERVYSTAPAMLPQIKGALSTQETATGPCLPVAWRKWAIGAHLPRSFSRAEPTLYSIIVDSFTVTFLGESVAIRKICFIHVTVLMLTSARCTYRCVREQCFLVGDVCFGDQSPCITDSCLLTATGLLLSKGTFLWEAQAWSRNPCHRTSILPHTSTWEDFKLNWKQTTLEMPSRRANGWRVWKKGFCAVFGRFGGFFIIIRTKNFVGVICKSSWHSCCGLQNFECCNVTTFRQSASSHG